MRRTPHACRTLFLACLAAASAAPRLEADPSAAPVAVAPAADSAAKPAADLPGQADLDAAIEAKLAARSLDDYGRVLELCKQAREKGLDDDGRAFADRLYTGTLVDRAAMLVEVIYDTAARDAQWPRMRAFAMRDLEEILDRDPKLGQAHLMVARLQALPQGDRERAGTAARAALELLGDDKLQRARAHVVLAGIAEDVDERRKQFDAAVELAPRDAETRRARGLFHLMEDEFDAARTDLEAAIAELPEDAALHEALGMACAMAEKLPEARKAFERAIELAPRAPGPLMQRARLLAVEQKFAEAIADLDRVVEVVPDDNGARLLRARVRMQANDEPGALDDLETVLRREPDNAAGLEMRGLMALGREDYAAAIRDFRRLVAKRPDDATLVGQLGLIYMAADQPRKAIERFTRALEIDDENFACRRARSDAAITIGDHEAALADLEVALTLKPDDTGVLNNLAWLLATSPDDDLRDGARAIELARKACESTDWDQPHMVSTLAAGYAEQGDFENARKYSQQAVDAGGVDNEIQEQLRKELESYEAGRPWRERKEAEDAALDDAAAPAGPALQAEPPAEPRTPRRPFDEE